MQYSTYELLVYLHVQCTCTCTCIIIIGSYMYFFSALMVGSGMVLTLCGERRPACVSLSQRRYSFHVPLTLTPSDSGRRLEKLSAQDPKVHTCTCMYCKARVARLNTCTSKISHLLLYPSLRPLVPGSLIYFWDHYWSVWKPSLRIMWGWKNNVTIDHLLFLEVRGRHVNL